MNTNECIAMILAGGRGERLGSLTRYYSKPAVHFGGGYRIIDFTLNNCLDSGIGTIGILSQYLADDLHAYITCVNRAENSDIFMLPPKSDNDFYRGTADAVYKNIEFIERFNPENVLILSGDHIYNMDYNEMLAFHMETGANITIASTPAPINDAPRFGIINAEKNGHVYSFEEKPTRPKSCLASMGIYIFKWSVLKRYLFMDSAGILTRHDFGRDVVPKMLREGEPVYAYQFDGYWRDVGTVGSLWEANMDQISGYHSTLLLSNDARKTHVHASVAPYHVARESELRHSIVSNGCSIIGHVEHSVLGDQVTVDSGAEVIDSVVMPGAYIGRNVKIYKAIIGTEAIIMDNTVIGTESGSDFFVDRKICTRAVSLVAPWLYVGESMNFRAGSHIHGEQLRKHSVSSNVAAEDCHHQAEFKYENYAVRQAVSL